MIRQHASTVHAKGLGCFLLLIAICLASWQFARFAKPGLGDGCVQRGFLDTVGALTLTADGVELSGWAYDKAGLSAVEVVARGRVVARMGPPIAREDVAEALRQCSGADTAGFSVRVPAHEIPMGGEVLEVVARSRLLGQWSLGTVHVGTGKPFGRLDAHPIIRWNGRNHVSGWVLAESVQGPPLVRLKLEDGTVIAQGAAHVARPDVGALFSGWRGASVAGFDFRLSMSELPLGDYEIGVEALAGERSTVIGTLAVENSDVPGFIEAGGRVLIEPDDVAVQVFLLARHDDIESVTLRAETGETLSPLAPIPFRPLAELAPEALLERGAELAVSEPLAFAGRLESGMLPFGTWRLVADVKRNDGRITRIQGPLVKRGKEALTACRSDPLRLFFPGGNYALTSGFPELSEQRKLIDGGCIQVGLRARVEYLRSTHGADHDFIFDPDLPESLRVWKGREMTGVSLRRLLDTARLLDVPLLVTLDGGVWADSAFPVPGFDVVDMLEKDAATVQWNQFGEAEPDDALSGLAGSIESPELARMMSLNRFNTRFLDYKKRNLQAAVREIVSFLNEHSDRYVAISLDPDQYINPWFYLEQWYDYNPDTLRQYREWLFHLGPYADDGKWAAERSRIRMSLREASRLAGHPFGAIDEVEPPRGAIDYDDRWQQLWTQFKRHLVARHYSDLARWANEAGMPAERIYTGQTFIQADVAMSVFERATGWTDQAGVSISGASPEHGRLGAILYGPASRNQGVPRSGATLIDNIRVLDPQWGSSEFHPATIEEPLRIPDHEESYLTVLEMTNGGARVLSPMWGSRGSDQLLEPARFRAYDAYERTPFETQLVWLMQARQQVAAGDLLFPFGNQLVSSLDRWRATTGSEAQPRAGEVRLRGDRPGLVSPEWGGLSVDKGALITVSGNWPESAVELLATVGTPGRIENLRIACKSSEGRARCILPSRDDRVLKRLEIRWHTAADVLVDSVRVERRTPVDP